MYVCTDICRPIYIYIYIHIYLCIYIHIYICICTYIHILAYLSRRSHTLTTPMEPLLFLRRSPRRTRRHFGGSALRKGGDYSLPFSSRSPFPPSGVRVWLRSERCGFRGIFQKHRENKSHKPSFCFRPVFDGSQPFQIAQGGGGTAQPVWPVGSPVLQAKTPHFSSPDLAW